MNRDQVRREVTDEFYSQLIKGIEEFNIPLHVANKLTDINPIFDLTGLCAGYAIPEVKRKGQSYGVRFNLDIASQEQNFETFLRRTVPHEVAHLIVFAMQDMDERWYNERGHGKYWRHVMRKLGVSDISRGHSYAGVKTARKVKRFIYECANCGETFKYSTRAHNLNQSRLKETGNNRYCCNHCKHKSPNPKTRHIAYTGSFEIAS